jgi:hypothetical protein
LAGVFFFDDLGWVITLFSVRLFINFVWYFGVTERLCYNRE